MIQRYEDRKKVVRLDNKYFEIDPGSWREDLDVDIQVGIGYGDQDVRLQNITNFTGLIEKVATQTKGIIQPQNIYNLVVEVADEMGIKNVDKFVSQPPTAPMPLSPQEQLAQAQAQALVTEAQASQLEAQVKAKELEIKAAKMELERIELEHDMALKREQLKLKGIELGFEMNSDKNIKA